MAAASQKLPRSQFITVARISASLMSVRVISRVFRGLALARRL
jgi:hypothetical protein